MLVREALVGAQRDALARLGQERALSTQTLRDIARELDLEELARAKRGVEARQPDPGP